MLNHSATHILHYALRDVLGTGVHQAGSLVAPDRLRFDFAHAGPVGEGDLATIEEEINARIRENAEVTTEEMAYDDAIKAGALAFFGDKYGDVVRVVRMGDFSVELCGGTHVGRTGDIGFFKLEAESGVAAGVRRIEAATGQGALEAIRRRERILETIGGHLGARDDAAVERLERLLAREKELEKKLRALEQKLVAGDGAAGGADAEKVREAGGVKVVTRQASKASTRARCARWPTGCARNMARRWWRSARTWRRQGGTPGRGHARPDRPNQGRRYREADCSDRRRHGRRTAGLRAGRRPRRLASRRGAGTDHVALVA